MIPLSEGEKLVQLVLGSRSWVHRRVDTWRLGEDGSTRRSVSLDITVPKDLVIPGSGNRVVVPLAIVEKGALRAFNTSDSSGHALVLLGKKRTATLALDLLKELTPQWIKSSANLLTHCNVHLETLIEATKDSAPKAEKEFKDWISCAVKTSSPLLDTPEQRQLDFFEQFALHFARNFLLSVELDDTLLGTRTVVKYSHDRETPDMWRGGWITTVRLTVIEFGFAASQHVEAHVPPGLAARLMILVVQPPDDGTPTRRELDMPKHGDERAIVHTSVMPDSRLDRATCAVYVVPSRQGIYPLTLWAVGLVGAAVAAAVVLKLHLMPLWFNVAVLTTEAKIPSPSASILLIFPALMLGWISHTREHYLTVMVLRPLRAILMLNALVLLLMAVAAAVPLAPVFWNMLWVVVAIVWFGSFVGLMYYRFKPRTHRIRKLLKSARLRSESSLTA